MESEARHYPPGHPWCRNPGWYHSLDSEATEAEVTELVAAFVRALQPDIALETGTHLAQTALAIGGALQRNGHGHLYSVEIDATLAVDAARACAGLPVTIVHADTLQWLPGWLENLDGLLDFAWVDSGPQRAEEAALLVPYFRPGAIMGIHDMAQNDWRWPFWQDFQPLVQAGKLQPITLRTPRGVTFAEVHP
jgi:predicted O-methyltransferase YrrM